MNTIYFKKFAILAVLIAGQALPAYALSSSPPADFEAMDSALGDIKRNMTNVYGTEYDLIGNTQTNLNTFKIEIEKLKQENQQLETRLANLKTKHPTELQQRQQQGAENWNKVKKWWNDPENREKWKRQREERERRQMYDGK